MENNITNLFFVLQNRVSKHNVDEIKLIFNLSQFLNQLPTIFLFYLNKIDYYLKKSTNAFIRVKWDEKSGPK